MRTARYVVYLGCMRVARECGWDVSVLENGWDGFDVIWSLPNNRFFMTFFHHKNLDYADVYNIDDMYAYVRKNLRGNFGGPLPRGYFHQC